MNMDVVAYDQIIMGLFPNKPRLRQHLRKRILHTHIMARIRNAKVSSERTPGLGEAISTLFKRYKDLPEFWYGAMPTLLIPNSMVRAMKGAYQRFSPTSGRHRARGYRSAMPGDCLLPLPGHTRPN